MALPLHPPYSSCSCKRRTPMASQFNNFRLALGCLNLGTGIVGTSFGQLIAMLGSNVSHSPEDPGVFPGWTLMATSAVLGLSGLLWLISSGIPDGKSLNVAAVASQVVAMLVTAAATTIIGIYALRYDS